MWYGFLISYVLMVVLFLTTSNAAFIQRYNTASNFVAGGSGAYKAIFDNAMANGFTESHTVSLLGTILVTPVALTSLGWVGYAQEQAGEIQGAQSLKNQMFINFGGGVVSMIMMAVLGLVVVRTVDQNWLSAAAYAAGAYNPAIPTPAIPPWFSSLAIMLTDSPILLFLMIIGIMLNAIQVVFNVIVGWTRVAVAMSIDGVLPKFVSHVSPRTHTPVYAHVIFLILGGYVFAYVYNLVPNYQVYTLAVTAVATVMYIGTALGGAVFPWTRKEVYRTAPISKFKFGPIPLITICGVIAAAFSATMLYYFLTVPFLVNVDLSNLGYSGNLFLYVVVAISFGWVGYYFVRRAYLRRIGVDLDLDTTQVCAAHEVVAHPAEEDGHNDVEEQIPGIAEVREIDVHEERHRQEVVEHRRAERGRDDPTDRNQGNRPDFELGDGRRPIDLLPRPWENRASEGRTDVHHGGDGGDRQRVDLVVGDEVVHIGEDVPAEDEEDHVRIDRGVGPRADVAHELGKHAVDRHSDRNPGPSNDHVEDDLDGIQHDPDDHEEQEDRAVRQHDGERAEPGRNRGRGDRRVVRTRGVGCGRQPVLVDGSHDDEAKHRHHDHADDAATEVNEHLVLQALRALDFSGLLLRISHPPKARQRDRGHEDRSQDGDGARGRESVCNRVVEDGLIRPRASCDERGCGVVSLSEGGVGGSQEEDDHEDVAEEEAVPHDPLELHEPAETLDEHKGGNGGRDHRHNRGAPAYQIPSAPVDQRVVARHDAEAREQRVDAQDGNEPAAERLPLEEERDDHHRDRGESEPGPQRPTLEDIVAARTGHGGGQARIDHGQEGREGAADKDPCPNGSSRV